MRAFLSVVSVFAFLVGCGSEDPAPPEMPTSDGYTGPAEQTSQAPPPQEAPKQIAPETGTTCSSDPDLGLASPVRKAMFDALRVPVEKALKQSVTFKVMAIHAKSGWVLLTAQPLRPDGSLVDYRNTEYQKAIDFGAFDDQVDTLLRYEPSSPGCAWKVYEWEIGSTDVAWIPWGPKYDVPEEVIPREKP